MAKYKIQEKPFVVPTTDGKLIEEHFGKATDGNSAISIAHMVAPPGWSEPFQNPDFEEFTCVFKNEKQFIFDNEKIVFEIGQSMKICKNTRAQYSNPFNEPCEYLAICTPAFSLENVNREDN